MFNLRSYKIGDKLAWWDQANPQFSKWSIGVIDETSLDRKRLFVTENCFGECSKCKAELSAKVSIQNFRIESIDSIQIYAPTKMGD